MSVDDFPEYGDCEARHKLDDLKSETVPVDAASKFIDVPSASRLIASSLIGYRDSIESGLWADTPHICELSGSERLQMTFAAIFDLICNVEYLHGRMVNDNWMYCNRNRDDTGGIYAYYTFLKQCPKCCLDRGLEGGRRGITGARHKPGSHHIGEITTTAVMLLLKLIVASASESPLKLAMIDNQSHDVDAVAYRDDLLVLFEIKASPLVTFPVRAQLDNSLTKSKEGEVREYDQHELVSIDYEKYKLDLYVPSTDIEVPLSDEMSEEWPYESVVDWISAPENLVRYVSSWLEIHNAYCIPKTERMGRDKVLGYLTNGWGDKIDSNKTKPGLGRTDDIKKGTYQLLKYGAYYRDGSPNLPVRSSLVSNLDPTFMYDKYIKKLINVMWSREYQIEGIEDDSTDTAKVSKSSLYYLYDSVLAFNEPVVNDKELKDHFSFSEADESIVNGDLNSLLNRWTDV